MYLKSMSTADLLVLIFYVLLYRILLPRFHHVFYLYTFGCRLISILIAAVIDCSVWLTVSFTFDRFVIICFQRFRRTYCSMKCATLIITVIYLLTYSRNLPYYFAILPIHVHNNIQFGCKTNPNIDTSPAWRAFYWLHTILTPLVPYVCVVLLNLLTIRHVLVASQIRRGFRGSGGEAGDPEMQSRRRALMLLFAASASFIILWMATVGLFLFSRITNTYFYRDFNDPFAIVNETSRMLRVLNCSTSTCMYALTQARFREELRKAMKYCANRISQFVTVANG
ncbi:probable G-protein coupled receptor 139 [Chiloscyllium plagiosum]|uniref:probable G-protein coupled receptor 139 n=1 Tax=Chiloscyllium plagiosum TaxID=36176 RepID=UPI001CB7B6E6|nr:probable G-protein coupled receptor 139 [Chiloscyllium plagiosum]